MTLTGMNIDIALLKKGELQRGLLLCFPMDEKKDQETVQLPSLLKDLRSQSLVI